MLQPIDNDGRPFSVPWQSAGGAVWFTETLSGKKPNRLQPTIWGKASTGPEIVLATRSTYLAEWDFVHDHRRSSVPATHQWTYMAPYEPWLLMGPSPGYQQWQWVGRKITDPERLDPYLVQEIARKWPSYFEAREPWTEFINGAIQYMAERTP
jgi:hypothetical protein